MQASGVTLTRLRLPPPHCSARPAARRSTHRSVAASTSSNTPESSEGPAVRRDAAPRVAAPPPPPAPVPVQHSSAYGRRVAPSVASTADSRRAPPVSRKNALQAALCSLDEQLDAMESVPNPVTKAAWTVGRVTTAASSSPRVQAAAKSTVNAGAEVLKKALPLGAKMGQWAVKAAMGVAASMDEAEQEEAEKKRPKVPVKKRGKK